MDSSKSIKDIKVVEITKLGDMNEYWRKLGIYGGGGLAIGFIIAKLLGLRKKSTWMTIGFGLGAGYVHEDFKKALFPLVYKK
jgi:hypothetical protein